MTQPGIKALTLSFNIYLRNFLKQKTGSTVLGHSNSGTVVGHYSSLCIQESVQIPVQVC